MGCGASSVPKAVAAANSAAANSPSAKRTLLCAPVSPKLFSGSSGNTSPGSSALQSWLSGAPSSTQFVDEAFSSCSPTEVELPSAIMPAELCPQTAYAPRLQASSQLYLASIDLALCVGKVDSHGDKVPTKPSSRKRYSPRLQECSGGLAWQVDLQGAAVNPRGAYLPRLQARNHIYLLSLADALGASAKAFQEVCISTPTYSNDTPEVATATHHLLGTAESEPSLTDVARRLAGDNVAIARGLADAAATMADSKPRVAAGLVVMAVAAAEATFDAHGAGRQPSAAAGLAAAASCAAIAGSGAAPGLVKAAVACAFDVLKLL